MESRRGRLICYGSLLRLQGKQRRFSNAGSVPCSHNTTAICTGSTPGLTNSPYSFETVTVQVPARLCTSPADPNPCERQLPTRISRQPQKAL